MGGATKRFGVSNRQMMRWVERGMVQAVRENFQGHRRVRWLIISAEAEAHIEKRTTRKRESQNAKLLDEGDAL